jgi:S1/P1 Nuclease
VNAKYTLWDDESLEIAESFVYTGITENTLPSAAYLKAGVDIAERQIVKGGYRLALQLETWWGATSIEEPIESSEELFTEFLE